MAKRCSEGEVEVVSEINTFLVSAPPEIKPLVKETNRIAKLTFSLPKFRTGESSASSSKEERLVFSDERKELKVDEDGDLVLTRKGDAASENLEETSMLIEYENSTTLHLVGLQVWRGAFLLADFIIDSAQEKFQGKNVVELGAGTGMSSIVAAMYAQKVITTDLNEPNILNLIEANIKHNKAFIKCPVVVTPLDFMDLAWSSELENYVASADVILAADVVYHVDITEAFVETLKKILCSGGEKPRAKDVFIALEKRYVFAISDLDTAAPMYSDFMEQLDSVLGLSPDPKPRPDEISLPGTPLRLSMKSLPLQFPQYFNYERCKQLVLLHIQSKS